VDDVEAVNRAQATQIAANASAIGALDTRVTDVEAVNRAQTNQIDANRSAILFLDSRVGDVETTNRAQQASINNLQTGLAAETSARIAADTALGNRVDLLALRLDQGLTVLDEKIAGSTAIAVAMSGNSFIPGQTFNLTANLATYDGAQAGAFQFGALVSPNAAVNAGIATNFNKRGSTALRAGVTIGW
jgi:hypothetical protein